MIALILFCMLACGDKDAVETPPSITQPPPPEAGCPTGCVPEPPQRAFPIGDGPTEFRWGDLLVGVGYRSVDQEVIYMFDGSLQPNPQTAWDPDPPSIVPYSKNHSPYRPNDTFGRDRTKQQAFPLLKCTSEGQCTACGFDDCFANQSAFDSGVAQVIAQRMGTSVEDVQDVMGVKATGDIGDSVNFDPAACTADLVTTPTYHHADIAKFGSATVGWQWFESSAEAHKARVVLWNPYTHITGFTHQDVTAPDNREAWCDLVANTCSNGSPCTMRDITFTYQ